MNRFSYFKTLYFELLIFLFVTNNSLQIFEVKGYIVELKNNFLTPILYLKNCLKNKRIILKNNSLLKAHFELNIDAMII